MNTTEDLRQALRDEPLPADGLEPAALVRLGRRRRTLRRLGLAGAGSLTVVGVALAARVAGRQPAGGAGERVDRI